MASENNVVVTTKHWWESTTIWTNVAALVFMVLALPEFISVVPQSWIPYIALITAILNGILRFRTTEPIGPMAESLRKR